MRATLTTAALCLFGCGSQASEHGTEDVTLSGSSGGEEVTTVSGAPPSGSLSPPAAERGGDQPAELAACDSSASPDSDVLVTGEGEDFYRILVRGRALEAIGLEGVRETLAQLRTLHADAERLVIVPTEGSEPEALASAGREQGFSDVCLYSGPPSALSVLAALTDDSVGDSPGFGGLGLRGTGVGAGGTGDGSIGLGDLGRVRREGTARSGGRPRVHFQVEVVRGELSGDAARRIIRRHISEIEFCYSNRAPPSQGDLEVEFTVDDQGSVSSSRVTESALDDAEACCVAAIRRWGFPSELHSTVRLSLSLSEPEID